MAQMSLDKLLDESRYIRISIPYRDQDELIHFDDGMITELECDEDFTIPMLNPETMLLECVIDFKDRKVIDWQHKDGYLRMWAKVRDGGTYTLLDKDKNPIWQICGYVPNKLIPPFEKGWGDYIELAVESDCTVVDWPENPDLSEFMEYGQLPKPVKTNKWYRAEDALLHIKCQRLTSDEISWLIDALKKEV